jgi:hypothetical protein
VTATLAAIAAAAILGPPSPVLHSSGERLTMKLGSFCWAEPAEAGGSTAICADTFRPAPVTKRSLPVRRHGRIRVNTRTKADSLTANLRGRMQELRVTRRSPRRFVIRLPRQMKRRVVLDLFASYPQGDGSFGARLRVRRGD